MIDRFITNLYLGGPVDMKGSIDMRVRKAFWLPGLSALIALAGCEQLSLSVAGDLASSSCDVTKRSHSRKGSRHLLVSSSQDGMRLASYTIEDSLQLSLWEAGKRLVVTSPVEAKNIQHLLISADKQVHNI